MEATWQNINERQRKFRKDRALPNLKGKTVILVDTGLRLRHACRHKVRKEGKKPARIVIAVPTASLRAVKLLSHEVDEIVYLNIRSGPVFAVLDAYRKRYDLTD